MKENPRLKQHLTFCPFKKLELHTYYSKFLKTAFFDFLLLSFFARCTILALLLLSMPHFFRQKTEWNLKHLFSHSTTSHSLVFLFIFHTDMVKPQYFFAMNISKQQKSKALKWKVYRGRVSV